MGTTKGGWVYAGQRPCYEAKTPAFYVMPSPLTEGQIATAMGVSPEDNQDLRPSESITSRELKELASRLMDSSAFSDAVGKLNGRWELRALTQAEWQAARNQKVLTLQNGLTERLADAPSSNNPAPTNCSVQQRPKPLPSPFIPETTPSPPSPACRSTGRCQRSWPGWCSHRFVARKSNGCPSTPTDGETCAPNCCGQRCWELYPRFSFRC